MEIVTYVCIHTSTGGHVHAPTHTHAHAFKHTRVVSWLHSIPTTWKAVLADEFAQTTAHAAKLRQKLQITPAVSPSNITLTPGQPALVLTLLRQVLGRVATTEPILRSLVELDQEKLCLIPVSRPPRWPSG